MLVVEDIVTTGHSADRVATAVREVGGCVCGLAVFFGARQGNP